MGIILKNSSTNLHKAWGRGLDRSLLLVVFALIGVGVVQVYSSSYIYATESFSDGLFFFRKQLLFAVLAAALLFIVALVPWKWLERWGFALWILAFVGIILTFVPGVGHRAGGAARWLQLPMGFRFEPSELMKVATPIMLSTLLTRRTEFFKGLHWVPPLLMIAAPLILMLAQPDFGSFVICAFVVVVMLFFYGLQWRYIFASIACAVPVIYFLVMRVPYRRARVLAFLDPWSDPAKGGFQVIQSMLSFHSGGLTGVGLGQGQGKLFFLPEAHTDFALSVLAEETGFIGFSFVLLLYGFLVLRGLQIGVKVQNPFARSLALGLTVCFGFQVAVNMGVVTGLLPTKGLALPFLSYGGSSLLMMGVTFGLLLNIERTYGDGRAVEAMK